MTTTDDHATPPDASPGRLTANGPARLDPDRERDWWQAFRDSPEGKSLMRDGVRLLIREIDALRAERDRWQQAAGRDHGIPGTLVGGGWAGTEPQDADWDGDSGERAREALADPEPAEPCPGYVPRGPGCQNCGELVFEHGHGDQGGRSS